MKKFLIHVFILCGLLPLPSIGQIGIADPVTGNATINFWGKVVDQDGRPIDGATVNLTLDYGWTRSPTEGGMKQEAKVLKTDENGKFELINAEGHGFDVKAINKTGYELSKKVARSYSYSWSANIFHPDPSNPVIFKMWKTKGAEHLIQPRTWNGNISCDGSTNRFDIFRGTKSPDGNLEINCTRNPVQILPREGRKFDYRFEITVRGGGIRPTQDEFTYLAPDSGYVPRFLEEKKADEQGWRGHLAQEFYFRTAEGKYGRISVDWYDWQQNPTHLDWNASINPSGSRNLER